MECARLREENARLAGRLAAAEAAARGAEAAAAEARTDGALRAQVAALRGEAQMELLTSQVGSVERRMLRAAACD